MRRALPGRLSSDLRGIDNRYDSERTCGCIIVVRTNKKPSGQPAAVLNIVGKPGRYERRCAGISPNQVAEIGAITMTRVELDLVLNVFHPSRHELIILAGQTWKRPENMRMRSPIQASECDGSHAELPVPCPFEAVAVHCSSFGTLHIPRNLWFSLEQLSSGDLHENFFHLAR